MTLKQLREKRNLTQEEASKILDINKCYLSQLENGIRNPSDKMKKKMAKLYQVEATEIFLACNLTK